MHSRQYFITLLKDAEPRIRSEFGVESMCIFGSVARGENHDGSDVDICVVMPPKAFKVLGLKSYLQDILETDVDVVRRTNRLDSFLQTQIDRDAIYIFK